MYNNLNVIDTNKRYFSAWATVEVQDTHGDYVNVDDLEKYLPIFMDRIPPLHVEHTSKTVGKVINAWVERDEDGNKGIKVMGRVFEDTVLDNSIWEMIKNGTIKGVSIGGEAKREGDNLNAPKTWEISLTERPANKRAKLLAVNNFAKKLARDVPQNSVPFDDPKEVPKGAKIITGPDGGKYYIPPVEEETQEEQVPDETGKPPPQGEVKPRSAEEYFHVKIVEVCQELQLPEEVMVIFEKQVFEALRNYDPRKVIANENRFMNVLRAHAQKLKEYYSETFLNKKNEDNNEEENMEKKEEKPPKEDKNPAKDKQEGKDTPKPDVEEKEKNPVNNPKNTPFKQEENVPQGNTPAPPPLDFGFDDTEIRGKLASLEAQVAKILEMISSAPNTPEPEKQKGEYMEDNKPEETKKSEIKENSMEELLKSSIEPLVQRLDELEKKYSELTEIKKSEDASEVKKSETKEIVAKTPEALNADVVDVIKSKEIDWNNSKDWAF